MNTTQMIQTGYDYSETQQLIADSAKSFAKQYIEPFVKEWDETQEFPVELMKLAGEHGFLGILVPHEYGGSEMGYHEYIAIVEEISKIDPSIGLSIAAHNSLCTNHILTFGSESQKRRWIPKLASGEFIGAWGLTEHNTGSDAGAMSTTAVKDGDQWILNGTKNFITHGKSGDVAVVIARTGEKGVSSNATAFVVERGTPGFSAGKKENKLGIRDS
jgi:alkylation response protein AidB-like acyl-CoA dehydrogenase